MRIEIEGDEKQIGKMLSIFAKRLEIGAIRKESNVAQKVKGKRTKKHKFERWSKTELETIKQYYDKIPKGKKIKKKALSKLARQLGRARHPICDQASRLRKEGEINGR